MTVMLGSAIGKLVINASGVKAGIGQANSALNGFKQLVSQTFAVAAGTLVARGFQVLTTGFINVGKEAVLSAARVDEMNGVLQLLGERAGFTPREIDKNVASIKDLGIQTNTAQNVVAQFARYNLDMADAVTISRVAQDAAVLSMTNSSEALDKLMHGILTHNTRVIRQAGLSISMQAAYKKEAAALGISTTAMTEHNKMMAILNAVKAEGAAIAGTYERSMESAGKKMRSLKRYWYEIGVNIGGPFQDAFSTAIDIITYFAKALKAATDEGGILWYILQRIGAAAAVVMEEFEKIARRIVDAILPNFQKMREGVSESFERAFVQGPDMARRKMVSRLMKAATDAFTWGIKITMQLAAGLIRGAAIAITKAMNYIGGLLAKWLAPSSPPLVAPDIGLWGGQTMMEFLRGMTEADFGVLQAIQDPIETALRTFADLKLIEEGAVAKAMRDLTQDLVGMVAQFKETGEIASDTLKDLAKIGGEYGKELIKLVKAQLAFAVASEEMKEAEGALRVVRDEYNALRGATRKAMDAQRLAFDLAKASLEALQSEYGILQSTTAKAITSQRTEATAARDRVKMLQDEYNALRKAKAAPDVIKAKLAEIRLAAKEAKNASSAYTATKAQTAAALAGKKAEVEAAGALVTEVEANVKALTLEQAQNEAILAVKQSQVDTAQAAYDLARARVEELEKESRLQQQILDQMIQMAEWSKGGNGAAAGGGGAGGGGAGGAMPELDMPGLGGGFGDLEGDLTSAFDLLKETIRTELEALWAESVQPSLDSMQESIQMVRDSFLGMIPDVNTATQSIRASILENFGPVKVWWDANWPGISETFSSAWEQITLAFAAAGTTIKEQVWPDIQEAFAAIGGILSDLGISWDDTGRVISAVVNFLLSIVRVLLAVVVGVIKGISSAIKALALWWRNQMVFMMMAVESFGAMFANFIMFWKKLLTGDLPGALKYLKDYLVAVFRFILAFFLMIVNGLTMGFQVLLAFIKGFVEGVVGFFQNLYDDLVGNSIVTDMMDKIETAFGILETISSNVVDWLLSITGGFDGIKEAVNNALTKLTDFINKLKNLIIPDAFNPGSPSPFETSLMNTSLYLNKMNQELTKMASQLGAMRSPTVGFGSGAAAGGRAGAGGQNTQVHMYGPTYITSPDDKQDFADKLQEIYD